MLYKKPFTLEDRMFLWRNKDQAADQLLPHYNLTNVTPDSVESAVPRDLWKVDKMMTKITN